jgi:hypothetical protein
MKKRHQDLMLEMLLCGMKHEEEYGQEENSASVMIDSSNANVLLM